MRCCILAYQKHILDFKLSSAVTERNRCNAHCPSSTPLTLVLVSFVLCPYVPKMCWTWDSLWASVSLLVNSRSCLQWEGYVQPFGLTDSGQPCTRVGRDRGQRNMQENTRHHERLSSDQSSAPPSTVTPTMSLVSRSLPGCWLQLEKIRCHLRWRCENGLWH